METVKELAKILEECDCRHSAEHCDICPYIGEEGCLSYFETARKLVEHGVTIATDTNVGDKWVSVDERLPEENDKDYYDTVILSLKDGRTVAGCYRSQDKEWWGDTEDGQYSNVTGDVTHWMPLPQPPKGVQ